MVRLSGTRTSPNRNIHSRWYNEELRDGSQTDTITPLVSQTCSTLFQIYHGSIGILHDPYILRHTPRPSRQTDMHILATYQCRTNYLKCYFFPQTIVAWNALPKSVVTSSTLDAFKSALPQGRPIPS